MELFGDLLAFARPFVPVLATFAVVAAVLATTHQLLNRRYGNYPQARFRIQMVLLTLTLLGILAIILALTHEDAEMRGQLLSFLGILLSAAIALSSTTFLGNALAGILLRVVAGFRIGDFIQVGEDFGRVSERSLLHTEIQTEDRNLTTLPNLYLVTNPVRVVPRPARSFRPPSLSATTSHARQSSRRSSTQRALRISRIRSSRSWSSAISRSPTASLAFSPRSSRSCRPDPTCAPQFSTPCTLAVLKSSHRPS